MELQATGEATPAGSLSASPTLPADTATPAPLPSPTLLVMFPAPPQTPTNAPQLQSAAMARQAQAAARFPYELQAGGPKYLPNFSRPALGCAVQSVAGQVFDLTGKPVKLLVVNVQGALNGKAIDNVGMTGNTTNYGPGGYEVDLGTKAFASSHTLFLWLTDLNGNPISDRIYFDTYADCQKNITLLNFQVNLPYKVFAPLIRR